MEIERREQKRQRVYKRVTYSFNKNNCSGDCMMRNKSVGGALIHFNDPNWVPSIFRLHDDLEGYSVECEIVRRSGLTAGVKFVGPIHSKIAARKQSITVTSSQPEASVPDTKPVAYSIYPAKFGRRPNPSS